MEISGKNIQCYPELRHDCNGCGRCCSRLWDIPVTEKEKEVIEKEIIPGIDIGEAKYFQRYKRTKYFLIGRRDNGRCVFLDDENLCIIHRIAGESKKPLACRLYPKDVFLWKDGLVSAGLRFDCPAAAMQEGGLLKQRKPEILGFAREMNRKSSIATALYSVNYDAELEKIRIISAAYRRFLLDEDFDILTRLFAAARLLEFHEGPQFRDDVRDAGSSFADDAFNFVSRSIDDLELTIASASPMNPNTRVIFRYIMSGYARLDSEVADGLPVLSRIKRAGTILSFILGAGSMEKLGGRYPNTRGIDPVTALTEAEFEDGAAEIYYVFLKSKLYSMHYCGNPALKLTFEQGMRHLLLSYPVTCAFAAMNAKVAGREKVSSEDFRFAIEIVDHTFGRSPFFRLKHVKRMVKKMTDYRNFPSLLKLLKREN